MANIQKALDALQPYVIGIRYLQGTPLVDVVFKEGWTLPEDAHITREKGDESMNYYMLFSQSPHIGLDELLAYVEKTIRLNQDREKKEDLLKAKINEMRQLFNKNSLTKLQTLKFTFKDDMVVDNFSLDIENDVQNTVKTPSVAEVEETEDSVVWSAPYQEEEYDEEPEIQEPIAYLDENKQPIALTEEDREIMAEEARAERNRIMIERRKEKRANAPALPKNKVELPPKRRVPAMAEEVHNYGSCNCGPDEACGECIDSKGY